MRTIDEVIESFERMSKISREKARSIKPVESYIVFINDLFELAEEEEQIANWLKELKRLTMTKNKGDLISREALKEELSGKEYITYTHEYGDAIPVEWIMGAIDNAPTVKLDESVIQEELNKRCMTAVANEYLIALHGNRPHDKERSCEDCKNYDIHTSDEMPCCKCSQLFHDYFEAKEAEE